nr:MAK10-like protein [Tanacetum cinerariifolium]
MQTGARDGVAGIKRRHRALSSDGVRNMATASGRGRLKEDLESSTRESCTRGDYSKPSHEGYRNTIEHPVGNNVVPLRSDTIRQTIDQSAGGKLCDRNAKKSLALLEELTLYDNEIWNDQRDFSKPVKAISLPQDVPSTSDRCLIDIENQVQRLIEAHISPTLPTQVKKITTSCEICSGPHDTQYCMENPKQSFIEYVSLCTNKAGGKPFVDISNMTHDLPEGVVRFTNRTDEIAYKMPHKKEQYNSLSNLQKEHTKSIYLRNEEDKRREVEYVMSKILGSYKKCLELGPEYVTGMDDEGEVM